MSTIQCIYHNTKGVYHIRSIYDLHVNTILPDYSKSTISDRSVGLVIYRMCGGRLCGMVRLLLSMEKLLRSTGLLVVADRTVRRALHQRHGHPRVSAWADHSHNRTSVTVNPRIPQCSSRFHLRPRSRWPERIHGSTGFSAESENKRQWTVGDRWESGIFSYNN